MYAPDRASGKSDVFQCVFPAVANTGTEPHPRFTGLFILRILSDMSLGIDIKCHDAFSLG